MKITDVRTHLMQAGAPPHTGWTGTGKSALSNSRNWLFVTVHTDEGLVGTGEGSGWPRIVAEAVNDLRYLLVGENPADIERISQKIRVAMMGHGQTGVVGSGAIAAIDIALWDLKAQRLGTSVVDLLGGQTRKTVPYYVHASNADTAREAIARGIRAVKVGGIPGIVDRAHEIRDAIGPDVDLMVDLHGPPWLSGADAVAIGRALEPLHLLFLEEPVSPENLDGWRLVRDKVDLPLAGGERLGTLHEMRTLIDEYLVDVLQPDTGRFGGLTQMKKLAGIAEARGLMIAPHSGSLGPVAEFAAVHLLASIPNALMLERLEPDWSGRADAIQGQLEVSEGKVLVPQRVGLGVQINEAFVAAHPSTRNNAIAGGGWNEGTADESVYMQVRRGRARLLGTRE